jgi:hypothetical protein
MGGDIKSSWNQVFVTLVISLVTGGVWLIYSDLDNKRKDELEY